MTKLNNNKNFSRLRILLLFFIFELSTGPLFALTLEQAKALCIGETDTRIQALNQVIKDPDEGTLVFLQALSDDSVKILENKVFIVKNNQGVDPVSGDHVDVPADAPPCLIAVAVVQAARERE